MQGKPEPVNIYIDRECTWYADGREVVNEKIHRLFCDSLVLEDDGYHVRIDYMENPVTVEDAPFCVKMVFMENTSEGRDILWLTLNDGRRVELDPGTLRAPSQDALYCAIPDGRGLEARFSAQAMNQFAAYLEHDEKRGAFLLELNGETHEIIPGGDAD